MRVAKRDQTIQVFNAAKIAKALYAAFASINTEVPRLKPIVDAVMRRIYKENTDTLPVERIQDLVENTLMESGHCEVARSYILYRNQRTQLRQQRLHPDPSALSDYVVAAKYARHLEKEQRRETWHEAVDRVLAMHLRKFTHLEPEYLAEIVDAFSYVQDKKTLGSMRAMQFGGRAMERDNERGYNCCATHLNRVRAFQEIMWLLLCGCGVGFSVQARHVEQLPRIARMDHSKVRHHVIEDTCQGWADAVGALWQAALDGVWVEFSYHKIRDEGVLLKTSGGRAPGHLGLKTALENCRLLLLNAQGRRLRPIECFDFVCHMAIAVLSGGIRRSSLLCLFDKDDTEMLFAKAHGNYDPSKGVNEQRSMANISAVLHRKHSTRRDFERIMEINAEWGEPNFYFTNDYDYIGNPCVEIGMFPKFYGDSGISFCNLTEINLALCREANDVFKAARAAAIIGTLQAAYTDFPYLGATTEKIVRREALIGVSMTGMADSPELAFDPNIQQQAARIVVETNQEWAEILGINPAARTTCNKPSGTTSLVLQCASGAHSHHARRYFRRVTANPNERPAQYFKKINPHMVEEKQNGDWALVFPTEAPENALTIKNESAVTFMERVFQTYDNWIVPGTAIPHSAPGLTHNVSATVCLSEGERGEVLEKIWKNRHRIAAMAFAPKNVDKLYPHAPREAITTAGDEARWNEIISKYTPIDWLKYHEEEDETSHTLEPACAGGECLI